MSGGHFHALRVGGIDAAADDAVAIRFEVPDGLREAYRFEPGQYLTLRHGEWRRAYSICSQPGQPLRVGVRRVAGGAFSGWLHRALKVGDRLDVMTPEGRFGAALAQRPRHLLAVAGGSGITPLLAIVSAALQADPDCRCTLVCGNRRAASMMFRDELLDLKDRYLPRFALHSVFSREEVDAPLHAGRIDAARLAAVLRLAGPVDQAFVGGPATLNDVAESALRAAGLAPAQIHIERFGLPPQAQALAPAAPQADDAATARVRLVRDGVAREITFRPGDGSLLGAAVRAGLDLPYSCRSGMCATCRARLLEGRVRMDRNFALEPDEVAAGFVLACQAHPQTERVVLSFDER
ncbi:MAG: 2Fe-2S iron-sulfur cluster binding domain-containing protein [Burkholderiales bacterium]|nr:2Fe-2S iron-sulfur cluster binding domain-containing protein [Burkholderiales bacterium]